MLHVDPNVKPVAQPLRRTPLNLQAKVENKIRELLDCDIIEEVDGPTPWVNPVVIYTGIYMKDQKMNDNALKKFAEA